MSLTTPSSPTRTQIIEVMRLHFQASVDKALEEVEKRDKVRHVVFA